MRRLVLGIAVAVTSLIPVLGMADDQQIADYIKSRLQVEQSQGNLKGFNVDMRVERGTVWFKGHVSNTAQEMTILKAAQQAGHLGVVQVVDDIEVRVMSAEQAASAPISNAGYQPQPMQQPAPQPQVMQQPMPNQPAPIAQISTEREIDTYYGEAQGVVTNGQPLAFASTNGSPMGQPPMGQPPMGQPPMGQAATGPAAMPISYSSSAGMPSETPNLPGYAWPGYAAHPNYAGVSYPQQYSASAWPYIGPFYPYPQVPLGWRKVSLEWDDGWWMLDFHDK